MHYIAYFTLYCSTHSISQFSNIVQTWSAWPSETFQRSHKKTKHTCNALHCNMFHIASIHNKCIYKITWHCRTLHYLIFTIVITIAKALHVLHTTNYIALNAHIHYITLQNEKFKHTHDMFHIPLNNKLRLISFHILH